MKMSSNGYLLAVDWPTHIARLESPHYAPIAVVVGMDANTIYANFHRPFEVVLIVLQMCDPALPLYRPFDVSNSRFQ